jgi:hypothetical protein
MESTQKYLTILLGLLVITLTVVLLVVWNENQNLKEAYYQNNGYSKVDMVPANSVMPKTETKPVTNSVPVISKSNTLSYKNTKLGFSLELPKEYVGYKVVESSNYVKNSGGKDLGFMVPTTGTNWDGNFEVFRILTYPLKWADANTHLSDGDLRLNSDDGLGGYLGQYLGKNANYIFAITKGQDCPSKGADNSYQTTQCYLYEHVDDLVKSFEILK